MSAHPHTILGPYVFCKTHKVTVHDKRRLCSNKKCREYKQEIWDRKKTECGNCGSPIEERDVPRECDAVDACELREKMDERLQDVSSSYELYKEPVHLWVSNLNNSSKRKQSFYPENEVKVEQVTPELIAAEMEEFKKFFAKELATLQTQGYDLVELRWGLINYIN